MDRIYIVEDNPVIAGEMKKYLETWGYSVKTAEDFQRIIEEFEDFEPKLVLMDISLPYFNGYHWCEEIRKTSNVPIIFVSSASDNMNIVMAVNMGGDDFIRKPFDLSILGAKVQAMMRRTYYIKEDSSVVEHRGVTLNLNTTELSYNGKTVELTKNDFKIMKLLLDNSGKVVSRDDIMNHLWENESFIDDNTLTVNMTRLRRKLEGIGLSGFVTTKKGMGYMIQ